ncbi:type I secretion system permease/ATPase [Benzoatithermus flavus]|uniref:Type I secretion system permease/ATPase n=1 Tax=Benzoatithermus flavus TaxID=3108223 RepID=A0ABU8XLE0_9PROT
MSNATTALAARVAEPAANEDDAASASWCPRADGSAVDDPLLDSLVALARLLDRPASAQALTAGLPLVQGRLTPELFPRAAARAGLSARLLRRPLEAIDPLALPCVLLLVGRQACVLLRLADDRALVVLPETGLGGMELPLPELAARYTGHAFFARPELARPARAGELQEERRGHWFWGTVLRQWPVYGEVALAAVLINLFALASPLFVMNVYDRVVPNNAIETLWVLAIGALIVFGFDFLLKVLRGYFVDVAGRASDMKLASAVFEQVMGLRLVAKPASAGVLANNLRELETIRDFFSSASITALVDLPFLLLFIAAIWLIGGRVAVVPATAVPLVLGAGLLLQLPLNRAVRTSLRQSAQKHGVLVEAINGLETIKSIGAEGRLQAAWERLVALSARSANVSRFFSTLTVHLTSLASNLVTVGVVIVGVYDIAAGRLTTGALVACSILSGRAMAPLAQVAGVLSRYHQAKGALDHLDAVMRLPVERPPERRFLHRPRLEGEIELKNVTFTYPGQKLPALVDVSFRVRRGERVGLIGRVGSGKTTIEKLILGLHEPDSGFVLVDGTELRQIDPADLRRNIGCVPQDVFLFQGTLRENIALGAPHADDAAILRAARIAGVDDFARRHPLGYDLPIGERGDTLSGGQRQAIAVARALLLDPPILVLDEPTSSMDNTAESRLKARLAEELAGRTLLLITHRVSLLSLVDRLIVLDGGRVVVDGPREQVLAMLAEAQAKGSR